MEPDDELGTVPVDPLEKAAEHIQRVFRGALARAEVEARPDIAAARARAEAVAAERRDLLDRAKEMEASVARLVAVHAAMLRTHEVRHSRAPSC